MSRNLLSEMNNLRSYKVAGIDEMMQLVGTDNTLSFFYSPDLAPVEGM